jgi:hypothetical protein
VIMERVWAHDVLEGLLEVAPQSGWLARAALRWMGSARVAA